MLKALSDPTIRNILELLAESGSEEGMWLGDIAANLRDLKDVKCTTENIYKKLKTLEENGLLRHGTGVRDKGEQGKWIPTSKEVYLSLLHMIEDVQSLAEIGSCTARVIALYLDIKTRFEKDPKRAQLLREFSETLGIVMKPYNFRLLGRALTWKICKMATDPDIDLDFSDLV